MAHGSTTGWETNINKYTTTEKYTSGGQKMWSVAVNLPATNRASLVLCPPLAVLLTATGAVPTRGRQVSPPLVTIWRF